MNKFDMIAIVVALAAIVTVTAEETPYQPAQDPAALAATPVWTAVAASGLVEAQSQPVAEDSWIRVKRGAELAERMALRTGRRGRATLARHADLLIVDPNSSLELPALRVDPGDDSTVVQSEGSVVYEVDGRKTRNFKVVTPYLVAGVKGTVFMVTVGDGSATVTVEEGVVEVMSLGTGAVSNIQAGQTVLVDADQGHDLEIISADDRPAGLASDRTRDLRRIARAESRHMNRVMYRGEEELRIAVEMGDVAHLDVFADAGALDPASTALLNEANQAEDRDTTGTEKIEPDIFIDPTVNPLPPQTPPTGPPTLPPGSTTPGSGKKQTPRQETSGSQN